MIRATSDFQTIKDEGHGITEESLKFWNENKWRIGEPQSLEASFEPLAIADDEIGTLEWNVEIRGQTGKILLSGCCCGYGGTGPNGTAKILAELGMPIEQARSLMWQKHFTYDVKHKTLS